MTKIFNIKEDARFYCFTNGVDMRKEIHSLYGLIKQNSELNALSGDVYIFI